MPTSRIKRLGEKSCLRSGMVEMIMFPSLLLESNARQQFVHLHLWAAGLVTITGPGKKTLQSHYNNDSNSGQERRSLGGALSPPSLLCPSTLTFNLPFNTVFSFFSPPPSVLAPLKTLFISLRVSFLTLQPHTHIGWPFSLILSEFIAP